MNRRDFIGGLNRQVTATYDFSDFSFKWGEQSSSGHERCFYFDCGAFIIQLRTLNLEIKHEYLCLSTHSIIFNISALVFYWQAIKNGTVTRKRYFDSFRSERVSFFADPAASFTFFEEGASLVSYFYWDGVVFLFFIFVFLVRGHL